MRDIRHKKIVLHVYARNDGIKKQKNLAQIKTISLNATIIETQSNFDHDHLVSPTKFDNLQTFYTKGSNLDGVKCIELVDLNIFYSGIEYTEKDWVRLKVYRVG